MKSEIDKIRQRIFIIECADKIKEPEKTELEELYQKLKDMESTNLLPVKTNLQHKIMFDKDKIDLIKKTVCPGATDDELKLFLMQSEKTGLDPFSRQIYSIERKSKKLNPITKAETWETKRTTQISIDGFRLIAQRSGKYAGQKPTEWCGKDGVWKNIWTEKDYPYAARVGVLRKDFTEPLYAIAKFDAYAFDPQGKVQNLWGKMPDHMLAKVAESSALRKAFPQELSGLYSSDEMENIIDITPKINVDKNINREEIYEATNEQKKILVDLLHKFGLKKHPHMSEDYKWFNEKLIGCKMPDLQDNVGLLLHEFRIHTEGNKQCQG
jgi:phage recombination protein Bet